MKRSIIVAFFLAVAFVVTTPVAYAGTPSTPTCALDSAGKCPSGPIVKVDGCVKIALPFIGGKGSGCVPNDPKNGGAIISYLKTILQVLSGLVGTVIVVMLVLAGIQYITAVGDPTNIKNAKNRVVNAVTALVLFLLMYAILGFLVPGGIL